MRVTTAFNRFLGVRASSVTAVTATHTSVEVQVRLARRNLVCPLCAYRTRRAYDTRRVMSRWRHLDVAGRRCHLVAQLRRLRCPSHGVRVEGVPFATPGSGFTNEMEQFIVWTATAMAWSTAATLCRVSWRTVRAVVERCVPHQVNLAAATGLRRLGVDEISYRRGHKYVTLVIDHDTGAVIWGAKGRTAAVLDGFFDQLGAANTAKIEAISMDFGAPYAKSVREKAPEAHICLDPFHAVALATKALDETRRAEWQIMRRLNPDAAARFKNTRFVLLKNPENLTPAQAKQLRGLKRHGNAIWRAYQLKEAFRQIYANKQLGLEATIRLLDAWIARAQRSRLPEFVKLAKTIRTRMDEVANTWIHGITNARNEGTHSKIRAVTARAHGYHSAESMLNMINLCCGPTPIPGPHPTPQP